MKLIDVHNHIQDEEFAGDFLAVLARAQRAGVSMMVCNGTSEADWKRVADLAKNFPPILPCFGLHPWFVKDRSDKWLSSLEKHLKKFPKAPVGEIGLDNWIEGFDEAAQQEVFSAQLKLAKELNRPATIHCVQAWGKMLELLKSFGPFENPVLLHAYSGPAEMIDELCGLGAYFSFAGSALRKTHVRTQETLKAIPATRLMVETDCPDIMPPEQYVVFQAKRKDGRGRNEPANIKGILEGIAQIRGEDKDVLGKTIWDNARKVFGIE